MRASRSNVEYHTIASKIPWGLRPSISESGPIQISNFLPDFCLSMAAMMPSALSRKKGGVDGYRGPLLFFAFQVDSSRPLWSRDAAKKLPSFDGCDSDETHKPDEKRRKIDTGWVKRPSFSSRNFLTYPVAASPVDMRSIT